MVKTFVAIFLRFGQNIDRLTRLKDLCFTGATCIAVRVDMSCFKIQVFDNGHGVQKDDLETVAER